MKFKGIELKGTFKVKFDDKWFEAYDEKGNMIYFENSNDFWVKKEYDKNGNLTYSEDSDRYWEKRERDEKGNLIYFENSSGYWVKREQDDKGNDIYYENSYGTIVDKRDKELTVEEIEKLLGYKIKIKGVNDETKRN